MQMENKVNTNNNNNNNTEASLEQRFPSDQPTDRLLAIITKG